MAHWLVKTEPSSYSFDDLLAEPNQETEWDGVRSYQARNFLRDGFKPGDQALVYHSNAKPPAIAGIAEVVSEATPDPTAFDPNDDHYDPKSRPESPTWYQVRLKATRAVDPPLTLPELRAEPRLEGLELLRKGSRLSVMPVSSAHWRVIQSLIKQKRKQKNQR